MSLSALDVTKETDSQPAGQTEEFTPEQAHLIKALGDDRFVWRTVSGLAQDTGSSEDAVKSTLSSLPPALLATASGKQGPLFTTFDHYMKKQSFLGKLLSVASGRFK